MKKLSDQAVHNLPLMCSLDQAAQVVGIGLSTAYRLAASNKFPVPVIRVGGQLKVRRQDLIRFVEGHSTIAASGHVI